MSDARDLITITDTARKAALVDRLKSMSAFSGEDLEGVSFITARDIEEAFEPEIEADYDHRFVAETPATGLVDLICPSCHQAVPDVLVSLVAVLTKEGDGPSKVKVKAKADARVHVCGQQPLPKPVEPEVEGQTEAFTEDDEEEDADDEAIERLGELGDEIEGAPA